MTRSGRVVGHLVVRQHGTTVYAIANQREHRGPAERMHTYEVPAMQHLLSTNSCAQPCFCASACVQSGTHRNFRCRSRIRVSNRLAMFHKQSAALTSLRPGQSSAARLCPPATIDRTDREPARRFGSPCQGTNSNTYSPWQASSFKKT